jgi:hypothetical protein
MLDFNHLATGMSTSRNAVRLMLTRARGVTASKLFRLTCGRSKGAVEDRNGRFNSRR